MEADIRLSPSNPDSSETDVEHQSQSRSHSKPNLDKPEKETPVPYSVRRLTPVECEILQGFPSGWTVPGIEL
jgi:site-specific DNA-cytosine methylase